MLTSRLVVVKFLLPFDNEVVVAPLSHLSIA